MYKNLTEAMPVSMKATFSMSNNTAMKSHQTIHPVPSKKDELEIKFQMYL